MTRIIPVSAIALLSACWLGTVGCSSSNDPSTGGTNTGSSGSGTTTAGTGTVSSAGTSSSSGGTTGTSQGGTDAGGTSSVAGTSAGGSDTTSGGSTGTGGTFTPLCATYPTTAAGPSPAKGGACAPSDPQLCYKTCGPESKGFKSETCTAGFYVEQSSCSFDPSLDASCYKIPDVKDASCPATTPQASQPCTVAACTVCNDANGMYADSKGTMKAGYCVCPAGAMSNWSCASTNAWPCPNGMGCN